MGKLFYIYYGCGKYLDSNLFLSNRALSTINGNISKFYSICSDFRFNRNSLLVLVGYVHWKRSSARKAEVDIFYEVNPYIVRVLVNTEMVVQMNLKLNQHILKLNQGQKLSEQEINDLSQLQEKLSEFTKTRKFRNKDDWKFFSNIDTQFKK